MPKSTDDQTNELNTIAAKVIGLLNSQQGQDAGFTEAGAVVDAEAGVIGFEHDGVEYFATLERA